ncbi:MAG TPA: multidrug ABC transporter [Clostridiales bacterium]|jgi:HAE1 family hydrophobic/amphiphilic exporter-1|nr:multidrug ABC transporter [Ruminiclostridium sp.]HCS73640.1 multidrug ABC transporter [Clostridiales bacterium]
MEKIAKFSVNRPVSITILTVAIIVLGFFNLSKLSVDSMPEMEMPMVTVMTTYSGASPEVVEEEVTKPLESALVSLSDVEDIESSSSSGSSTIMITFAYGIDMDEAALNVRDKVGMVESRLPDNAGSPTIMKFDSSSMPIIQFCISGENMSLAKLQDMYDDTIEPRLSRIAEVASVSITGGQEREIQVQLDENKMENYRLTLQDITNSMQAYNFDLSTGSLRYGERKYYIRTMQEFDQVDEIGNISITTAGGNTIHLKDIAEIEDTTADTDEYARLNGETSVGIACQKESGANTVDACTEVKNEMEQISQELGGELHYEIIFDQSESIEESLASTKRMVYEGAVLAAIVLLLFLRKWRSTVIVFIAIPLSLIATFIGMYFLGYTVNTITLGGLALGIGRIIDDSIVVYENIHRHRGLGLPMKEAAITGAREVGGAVLASTSTLMAVFLPMMTVEGMVGMMFKPLAATICIAIACSYVVAITVIPMLSARFLTDKVIMEADTNRPKNIFARMVNRFGHAIDGLGEKYKNILAWSLNHRKKVILAVVGLMLVSLLSFTTIGMEFMPSSDSDELSIDIEADKGSSLDDTDAIVARVEEILMQVPEMKDVYATIGSAGAGPGGGSNENEASITATLDDGMEDRRSTDKIMEELRSSVKPVTGAKIEITKNTTMGSMAGDDISVEIQGDDLDTLKELASQMADIVRGIDGARNVSNSLSDGDPQVKVNIDEDKAAMYGLTPMAIASEVNNIMNGVNASAYTDNGDDIDVKVVYKDSHPDLKYLKDLTITNASGTRVKLADVADFALDRSAVKIKRVDQVRQAVVSGDIYGRDNRSVNQEIMSKTSALKLPDGYSINFGGANRNMTESFSSLLIALLLAIFLVYVVMAVQYESFFDPFIVMFTMPTALIGAILSLAVTGRSLSVSAFLGIIMLMGIVVANAIVLIDYLKQLRERGMERDEAILEAGRVRLRPILMSSFATMLAMLPMALGLGEGGSTMAPMATVVIGGLLVSTVLTLVFVPVLYSIFDDWINKIISKLFGNKSKLVLEDQPVNR